MSNYRHLIRRDIDLGTFNPLLINRAQTARTDWASGQPVYLPAIAKDLLKSNSKHIARSAALHTHVLAGRSAEDFFDQPFYADRWQDHFEALGSSVNPAAEQEIETLFFDGLDSNNNIVAEDLWVKLSWLSFIEGDDSLRFRFSFGVDHEEDVAADAQRQSYAALLAQSLFPESQMITANAALSAHLHRLLGTKSVSFVERIIYFNAHNGGAYLHHDLERGHAGVVYLQVSGETLWLAMPKLTLINEIQSHIAKLQKHDLWPTSLTRKAREHLSQLSHSSQALDLALNSFNDDALIHLINETPAFVQQLVEHGHGYILTPGDAILLPQETGNQVAPSNCCWHTVFTLGEEVGEGLSFAIR